MESKADPALPKLPLLSSLPPMQSPEPSGMLTPPIYTLASVPFRWEEKPGKPRHCTALITLPNNIEPKCLDLPPRLLMMDSNITKTPSPTNVLDGPYVGSPIFSSSSFRLLSSKSFERSSSMSLERGQLGTIVLGKRGNNEGGLFGTRAKKSRIKRNGSFSTLSRPKSHFLATIYEGFKQVLPWKSSKSKKGTIN